MNQDPGSKLVMIFFPVIHSQEQKNYPSSLKNDLDEAVKLNFIESCIHLFITLYDKKYEAYVAHFCCISKYYGCIRKKELTQVF